MKNQFIELRNNTVICVGTIEITSVPTLLSLEESYRPDQSIEDEYRKAFEYALTEVYQTYKSYLVEDPKSDVSIESLWVTESVDNQPFKAKIRPFFVIRVVGAVKDRVNDTFTSVYHSLTSNLKTLKYGVEDIDEPDLKSILSKVSTESVRTVVKDETLISLQNQMMPYCYSFDTFDVPTKDFASIVDVLIEHPGCAVSIQLMPTMLNGQERETITQFSQTLDTLSRGVMAEGVGQIGFSAAESVAEVYKYYQNNQNSALFEYNILFYGDERSINSIASSYLSFANHEDGRTVFLKSIRMKFSDIEPIKNLPFIPWIAKEFIQKYDRNRQIWSQGTFNALYRMPFVVTPEEITTYFRLPIGSKTIAAGLPVNDTDIISKTYSDNLINTGDIEIGKLKSTHGVDSIGISTKDLAKHMLVVGTPGSGKTTFSVGLLDRLWKDHHIPFLVIEPAKNEYRALIQSIPDLQVFTPGKNFISPFVFNPFVPPKNVRLETYKSTLKTAFAAGVSMTTPLDKIFEESINNCYSDFRWLDNYTSDDKGKTFNISDFIKCFQETFDAIGYTGDAKNIGRAGMVRLRSLINLFDNYYSIPIEEILKKPTIIELAAIENADEKALIIALLLLSILSYVNSNYVGEGGLKNVILLEEAHVLLDANSNAGEGEANPSAIAQGLVKRMLAEIRSYGVGLIIADQSPRKVTTDVVALTDMKVVFRLVENEDKQIIADSINMSEAQVKRMARLKPGEAFLFFNRLDEPEEVITPDYRLENKINITLSDESISKLSTYWKSRQDKLRPYPECQLIKHCQSTCDYNTRILAREIARRIFVRHFKQDDTSFDPVIYVFGHLSKLVKSELNDEPLTNRLISCVKCQLWRKIKYETKIPVSDKQIKNSLSK